MSRLEMAEILKTVNKLLMRTNYMSVLNEAKYGIID